MQKTPKKIALALHDVSADNYSKMAPIIKFCRDLGWLNIDLMVIPAFNCADRSLIPPINEGFNAFLKEAKAQGANLWLHGFNHKADAHNFKTLSGRLIQSIVRGEAEFFGLNRDEAKLRLDQALNAWNQLDVGKAYGFVAPTWHTDPFLKELVLARKMRYESRLRIYETSEKSEFSIPLSLMDRQPLWSMSKCLFSQLIRTNLNFRVVIHPFDFEKSRGEKVKLWLKDIAETSLC